MVTFKKNFIETLVYKYKFKLTVILLSYPVPF